LHQTIEVFLDANTCSQKFMYFSDMYNFIEITIFFLFQSISS